MFDGREVIERLVRADGVVLGNPVGDDGSGVLEGGESMEPDALFFEGADEALATAVLLGCIRGDVFLFEAVAADGGAVEAGAKDEPVDEAQPGPDRADAEGGLRLDEFLDASFEHRTELGPRHGAAFLEKIVVDGFHEMPSGKSLPSMRWAF